MTKPAEREPAAGIGPDARSFRAITRLEYFDSGDRLALSVNDAAADRAGAAAIEGATLEASRQE